jgi:hypothetical protein
MRNIGFGYSCRLAHPPAQSIAWKRQPCFHEAYATSGGQHVVVALLDQVTERGSDEDAEGASRSAPLPYSLFGFDDGVSGLTQDVGDAANKVAVLLFLLFWQLVPRKQTHVLLFFRIRISRV